MSKNEISSKLDEIVDFSGIGKYLDTPVKRYSSGMKVRLGFAVAAHLEPEILIVDEVLAVGDADFQKKCIGKMNDVSKNQGRTVLFVSHNMSSVLELCDRGVMMKNGEVVYQGGIKETVAQYLSSSRAEEVGSLSEIKNRLGNGKLKFKSFDLFDEKGNSIDSVLCGQTFKIKLKLDNNLTTEEKVHFSFKIVNENDGPLSHVSNSIVNGTEFEVKPGSETIVSITINKLPLNEGVYGFHLFCSNFKEIYDKIEFAGKINVGGGNFYQSGKLPKGSLSPFLIDYDFKLENR
jgi:lipopolysaccharide transport system ATP-binding protein